MIRFIRLNVVLRARLVVNGLRHGIRRGEIAALAAVAEVVVPAVFAVLLTALAVGFGWLGLACGRALVTPEDSLPYVYVVRIATFCLLLTMVLAPGIRSARASTAERTRFLLLPLTRRSLHAAELLTNLVDPWILVVLPALMLLSFGAFARVGSLAGVIIVVAGVLFLLLLAELAALASSLAHLLMRDRRRGELVVVAGMSLMMLPALGGRTVEKWTEARPASESSLIQPARDVGDMFPWWTLGVPSEAHARTVAYAARGELVSVFPSLLSLAIAVVVTYQLCWITWRRLVESPATASSSGRVDLSTVPLRRLPWLATGLAAIALTEVRVVLRTVRGKLSVFLTPLTMVVLNIAFSGSASDELPSWLRSDPGPFFALSGIMLGLLSLLPSLANQFGSDRGGVTRQFLAPITDRDVIFGKAIGGGLLAALCAAPCIGFAALMTDGTLVDWLTVAVVGVAGYVLFAPLAAWLSILLPKRADLSAIGNEGNPHPLANVGGSVMLFVCFAPPMALAGLARPVVGDLPALGVVIVWCALVAPLAWGMLRICAGFLASRRDAIAMVAERS